MEDFASASFSRAVSSMSKYLAIAADDRRVQKISHHGVKGLYPRFSFVTRMMSSFCVQKEKGHESGVHFHHVFILTFRGHDAHGTYNSRDILN